MNKRKFGEMVAFFNRRVSEMNISRKCKIELLGMITAIEIEHDEEMAEQTVKTAVQYIAVEKDGAKSKTKG